KHLKDYLRQSDMVVRWGGEEFVVILPNTDVIGLEIIMLRIIDKWFGQRPEGTPLTASIGYAERLSDNVSDWPELIKLADERMYQAKEGGRARVVGCDEKVLLAQDEMPA
ncbi:MAG: GGDEF domain-containing protein, partial [gamma proteobacterium symbiont of Lucinoma myriamae]|nr:GGDEF domain-containing protein [gamma proteobacterium symbiont of Lucinoma myriamae]